MVDKWDIKEKWYKREVAWSLLQKRRIIVLIRLQAVEIEREVMICFCMRSIMIVTTINVSESF